MNPSSKNLQSDLLQGEQRTIEEKCCTSPGSVDLCHCVGWVPVGLGVGTLHGRLNRIILLINTPSVPNYWS